MAIKLPNGDILRNLQEQVQKNKEDIQRHYEIERVLADWGIRVIGQMEVWEIPTGSFEYGDAYAVGPDGGPFVFYIYTRGNPDYWFDYGSISIVGPQGPAGIGERGETGERGSWWYVGSNPPTGDIKQNDIWLRTSNEGYTDGFIYVYQNNNWALATSIKGPAGTNGVGIASTRIENNNLIITYSNGETVNLGRVVGSNGKNGADGITSLVYIIGSLPEGSIISDTYDPSTQEPNAGVLMPVGGVQHVFIVVDGNWTDAGPYSGGSAVYANGEYVQTFDADTKLDKISTTTSGLREVYARNPDGAQTTVGITASDGSSTSGRICGYLASNTGKTQPAGYLVSHNPINNYHVATKSYVDNKIAKAHGELQHTTLEWFKGQPLQFTVDMGVYINPSMPSMPNAFQLYGIGGYVLSGGNYWSNGPSTNELSFSMKNSTIKLTSYNPGSTTATTTAQFQINDYTLNGRIATFILTADDFGPDGGIFTFDCIPHSPSNI